jgi:chromosomal replication initiator protein
MDIVLEKKPVLLTASQVWNDCLNIIKSNVSPMTYNTWFVPIKPLELIESKIKIQLPNSYYYEWIDQRYNTLLHKSIKETLGEDGSIEYVIQEETNEPKLDRPINIRIKAPEIRIPVRVNADFKTGLNPKYSFENFIKGSGNELAHAAGLAVSNTPVGSSFNPLFIYGGVGLGKTHLLHAIGNRVVATHPEMRVHYVSTEEFTVKFLESIQNNTVNDFQNFYRNVDVLILDDIQFLIGKEKTQDHFFHTFNSLYNSGKQIILTSDKPPKDLRGLDERLISRFHMGLTADITPPDYETRLVILNKKADEIGLSIQPGILDYIASNITSNIRELEGCLLKLLANVSLTARDMDLPMAKRTVQEISTTRKSHISVDMITKIVCDAMKIDENKVRDKTRKAEIALARQMAMYLSKELTKNSLKNIGLYFGGRDHSTVIHACTTVKSLMESDNRFHDQINAIKLRIETAGV